MACSRHIDTDSIYAQSSGPFSFHGRQLIATASNPHRSDVTQLNRGKPERSLLRIDQTPKARYTRQLIKVDPKDHVYN